MARKKQMSKMKSVRGRGTKVVSVARDMTGKTNVRRDSKFKALKPGLRRTAWGSEYYEGRKNRADTRGYTTKRKSKKKSMGRL